MMNITMKVMKSMMTMMHVYTHTKKKMHTHITYTYIHTYMQYVYTDVNYVKHTSHLFSCSS
jgi:hypothetical protein